MLIKETAYINDEMAFLAQETAISIKEMEYEIKEMMILELFVPFDHQDTRAGGRITRLINGMK